ncbi:acyl-CoA dehydrogenase family protein [Desulfurispora thermophila]|uniref:acyl-CoA dehydrogenase family protein n=1 Tax=Desulfurispora thermophila TaxID=265470 RepID=UPI000379A62C|nr:acyl-CoA dehydrogenase family protein [Desulfurispora thermophila]
MVSFELTPAQEELREEVRALVQERIAPAALQIDRQGDLSFDYSLAGLLAGKNLLAPTVPREYGGRGLDYFTTALLLEEISAGCAGLAAVVMANIHAASPLILAGSREQKQKYLPLLTGPQANLAAFALTEKAAGSDMGALETSATPCREESAAPAGGGGQRWLLNGSKDYVINGGVARFITLFATTDPANKRGSMLSFLVPGDAPGLQVGAVRQKMGIRYAHTVQLLFNNVRLEAENVIGRPGSAYLLLMQTFDRGRALAGAIGIGIARAAYEYALQYSKERVQFGRPVFSHQGVSFTLAELATSIEAARLLVWKACWLIDRDLDYSMASSMAKLAASRVAVQVTAKAMEICGGSSYLQGHPVEMYLRDARVLPIIEGTDNVQKLVITSLL